MNEEQILNRIVNGDKEAFELLYKTFSDKVYNTSLSYCKNNEDAEEITQNVFVKIYENAATFQKKSSLSTWIYRITVNTSLNFLKKKNRFSLFRSLPNNADIIDFNHPGVLLEQKENAKMLFRVIDYLPDRQKTAFILSFIENLPRQEVADIMEISLKSVESLLQRAKQNLRSRLKNNYPDRRK